MQCIKLLTCICGLLLLNACGGGKGFVPATGPFSGTLTTTAGPLGQFTFTTTTDGLLQGTGTLTISGNLVPVSITGLLAGTSITANLTNVNLGGGDFKGNFVSKNIALGTFTYVDAAQTVHLSGTWQANL